MEKIAKVIHGLAIAVVVLLLAHSLVFAYCYATLSNPPMDIMSPLTHGFVMLVLLHAVWGVYVSIPSLKASFQSKRWYLSQNAGFWVKRVTAVVMLVVVFVHMGIWGHFDPAQGQYVLDFFGPVQLASQLLFFAAIWIHILVSIRPMLVACGVLRFETAARVLYVVFTLIMLFWCVCLTKYSMLYW